MSRTIRWGIWGAGAIADKVAKDLRLADGNRLHAVASRRVTRAEEFAAKHGASKWYATLDELLADADVDAVYIATPNHLHLVDCLACIEAGKATLCEKPFALNEQQVQQIADAARRKQVFCMEAMWTRFLPAIVEAKQMVASGALGPVRMIQGNFAHLAAADPAGRLYDPGMGGGVLLDLGVYLLSLTQHLLGIPTSVHGSATLAATGVDEQSCYQLQYESGTLVDLSASLTVRGTNEFFIAGEGGSLRICDPFYAAFRLIHSSYVRPTQMDHGVNKSGGGASRIKSLPVMQSVQRRAGSMLKRLRGEKSLDFHFSGYGYQFQMMEVSRCLLEGKTESDVMPLDDSLAVVRIMDALRAQWGLVYPGE